MADVDLRHAASDHREAEWLTGGVEAEGFAQTAQANVAALAHVQTTGIGNVQHDALTHCDFVAAKEFFHGGVINAPGNVQGQAGLGRILLGLPLTALDFFCHGSVFADGYWNRLGVIGIGHLHVEELFWIEHGKAP